MVAVDVEHASPEEVLEQVGGLISEQRHGREGEAIERLEQGLVAQAAEVLIVEGDALDGHGQIAALLRY